MSILSGPEIERQIQLGAIRIDPFDPKLVGPNSVDLRLGPTLLLMDDLTLDITKEPRWVQEITIPNDGYVLQAGVGYLGCTIETICAEGFVPWADGRSTTGRYFLSVHQTAGRADDGFNGTLTLELCAVHRPVRVFAGAPIVQVSFFTLEGTRRSYSGRYQGQTGPRLPKPLRLDK